ncbi:MFS transporter [Lysobacter antibioticus]|uniref:Major Facilitator Superfamily protein n=1 Tax=Lysobacter antibioticus TaxID=84531 RepID=A0A0S2FAM6_LYSAN|nr:MFS transporter [Lysobacter antibioticus]ALN80585.1 major Facilitator Superfamily protein [Lysobacter antibioticus]
MNRGRMILAMILTYMVFGILLNSVGTVILQSIQGFGISKSDASILEAFKDLPIAIVSFLTASLMPRLGYRRAMMLGLGLVGAACLLMPLLASFWMTKLLFVATGVSFALVKVSVYSSIGLLTEDKQAHASLTSTIEGWFMVGVLAGYWIFAWFIDPQSPGDPVWLRVYWLLAAIAATILALLATSRMDERAASDGHAVGDSFLDMFRLVAQPLVAVFLVSAFLYVLIEQSVGTWLPTFNREILHLPTTMSVQAASIFAVSLALGRLAAGVALRRVPWHWLLMVCVLAMAALVLLALPLARNLQPNPAMSWAHAPLAAYVFPLIGLFMAPIYPAINSVVLSSLPKSRHAAMTGLIVVFSALGGTTGSFITGQLFARIGGGTAFYLSLLPMAMLLLAIALLKRQSGLAERAAMAPS